MKILMVCLGNICRSPIAHGIMEQLSKDHNLGWDIDSAGTSGWHNGEGPDTRSVKVSKLNGIDISRQISRQVTLTDFEYYDLIFAMDQSNYRDLIKLAKTEHQDKVKLFLSYGNITEREDVPDPYYTGGFDYVFNLINDACKNIVSQHN